MGSLSRGFGARLMLAAIGGLAAMMSGVTGERYSQHETQSPVNRRRGRTRSRIIGAAKVSGSKRHRITGYSVTEQGRVLKAYFDKKSINMSAKRNKVKASFAR